MKHGILPFAFLALVVGGAAHADVVGFKAGAAYWSQSPSGEFEDGDNGEFDVEDDLGIDSAGNVTLWASLEHPVPVLPNIKLQRTGLSLDGSGTVETTFTVDDTTYPVSEDVDSEISLNQTDFIFYYELLDNYANLDLGVNVKLIDGEITVDGENVGRETLDFTAPVPMLYAHGRFDFPTTDISVGAEGSYIGYSGNKFFDAKVYAAYTFKMGLGVEGGLRTMQLTLDDMDDVNADFKVSGPYLGVTFEM